MKKVLLFLAVAVMSMTAMAQKKVAILETVDKSGEISYAIKMMLRNSLTMAISNTPGYEGYDRVDMASISQEQEFQRTGLVSDEQIKQLGVATGAAYVLVAEAAKYDAENIIITAKILNVETFGVENVAMQVTGTAADQMKKSCATLAKKLLKPSKESANEQPESNSHNLWLGIAIEGGMDFCLYEYTNSKELIKSPTIGLAVDVPFIASETFSFGASASVNINNGIFGGYGGVLAKINFKNNSAMLLGAGFASISTYLQYYAKLGYKFSSPWYITAIGYTGETNGFLVGIGYSIIGGKKK